MAMGYFNRAFAMVCIFAAGPALITPAGPMFLVEEERGGPQVPNRQRKALASAPTRWRRGKRAPAKPKRHSNRLHISKRVRRKHRRAA